MNYPTIIISGLPGSGKSVLAESLSRRYHLPHHSLGKYWRQEYEKRHPNKEISFEEFWRNTTLQENKASSESMLPLLKTGNLVAEVRYVPPQWTNIQAVRVFCTADINIRAKRALELRKYPEKTLEQITIILQSRDEDEKVKGREMFDFDYRDPNLYDLLLNTGKLTLQEERELVEKLIDLRRIK